MHLFGSNARPPQLAPFPQSNVAMFQSETQTMIEITRMANQLATETFKAVNLARKLKNMEKPRTDGFSQASKAKALLKGLHQKTAGTAEELMYFNQTYDLAATQLDKLATSRSGVRQPLCADEGILSTAKGYTPSWLQNEVQRRVGFVSDVLNEGYSAVLEATEILNAAASRQGERVTVDIVKIWDDATQWASGKKVL